MSVREGIISEDALDQLNKAVRQISRDIQEDGGDKNDARLFIFTKVRRALR